MTTLIARQPLQSLSMSSSQRGPRRLSARLQEKEDVHPHTNGYHVPAQNPTSGPQNNGASTKRAHDKPPATKKRRIEYDEEDDGFVFTRAKARKSRHSNSTITVIPEQSVAEKENSRLTEDAKILLKSDQSEPKEPPKKRRNKLSFSTPNIKDERPVRRSKRLSDEAERRDGSPQRKPPRKDPEPLEDSRKQKEIKRPPEEHKTPRPPPTDASEEHSATKIALPFADTPIIRKNKAMREGKGNRRSSLGLRGRRASSLIDSGNSNALPHSEVQVSDFYKHIESEGLPEPRRMRQLLTWCATRAMGERSEGSSDSHPGYEDPSARLAARVIQEELLGDLANRSEMSDWFSREDVQKPEEPLPVKPNPKNAQNATKIEQLEAQIRRLKSERQSLESLLRPPLIPSISQDALQLPPHAHPPAIDTSLLSFSDTEILESLRTTSVNPTTISARINHISSSLGPTIDAFADGIHKIAQYREAAERVSGKVLSICAEQLEERDRQGKRRAGNLEPGDSPSGHDDLTGVLRSLSKIER